MSSCERPSNSSGSDFGPSSLANPYCFSTGTHGSPRRCSSTRLACSSRRSAASSSLRAACHSCSVLPSSDLLRVGLVLVGATVVPRTRSRASRARPPPRAGHQSIGIRLESPHVAAIGGRSLSGSAAGATSTGSTRGPRRAPWSRHAFVAMRYSQARNDHRPSRLNRARAPPGARKRVLRQVLGGLERSDHAVAVHPQLAPLAFEKRGEGGLVGIHHQLRPRSPALLIGSRRLVQVPVGALGRRGRPTLAVIAPPLHAVGVVDDRSTDPPSGASPGLASSQRPRP
jgi:hypothetical protein